MREQDPMWAHGNPLTQTAVFSLLVFAATKVAWAREAHFEPIRVVHAVEPRYPSRSVATGTVVLRLVVNESGAVDRVDVIHGIPSLTQEAEATVRKWKFHPAERDGVSVRSSIVTALGFNDSWSPGPAWVAKPQPEKSSGFHPIQIISTVGAGYPFGSIAGGGVASVSVILQVDVGDTGAIDRFDVIHGVPSLTEEAERTLRKWRLLPATFHGKPVSSAFIASFTFRVPAMPPNFTG